MQTVHVKQTSVLLLVYRQYTDTCKIKNVELETIAYVIHVNCVHLKNHVIRVIYKNIYEKR